MRAPLISTGALARGGGKGAATAGPREAARRILNIARRLDVTADVSSLPGPKAIYRVLTSANS